MCPIMLGLELVALTNLNQNMYVWFVSVNKCVRKKYIMNTFSPRMVKFDIEVIVIKPEELSTARMILLWLWCV